MTDAYVMLNCELGAEEKIIEQLKELEQVVDVFETIGTHDMMVKLQGDNFEKIREIVSWNIQKLDKVRSTATLIKKDNWFNTLKFKIIYDFLWIYHLKNSQLFW